MDTLVHMIGYYHYAFETLFIAVLIGCFLFTRRRRSRSNDTPLLSDKEMEDRLAEWHPEPLVPDTPPDHPALNPRYIDGKMGKMVSIDGQHYLNLATSNFLGLVGDERIEEVAKKTIYKYGVGSCGPRGFYGTVDVHLDLEKQLATFMHCEEAVLYSYGFATVASAIPAYAKRTDVIFADKGVNFAIQKGLQASRSRIEWFNHNDVDDLERLLKVQAELDVKDPKKAKVTRRFMVVEGLYLNSGDMCPLPALMALKWKYKVRIFIDESLSFGVIGQHGRGVTEHFDVDVTDVDMIMASLENGLASTGGFCCGRSYVVSHQRLSGLGYCFSASLPPLLTTAASEGLRIMESEPERFERLRSNSRRLQEGLRRALKQTAFFVQGIELSPVVHLKYRPADSDVDVARHLDAVVDGAFEKGIALTRARYLADEEAFPIEPSIRITMNSELSADEIDKAVQTIADVARGVI